MTDDDDMNYDGFEHPRSRRMRITAWIVIISMILVGGGATVLALLFG